MIVASNARPGMVISRRALLRMIGAGYALVKLPACTKSGDGTFTADQLAMLNGFADAVLPRDDQPGGADLGAATYIERLIHAYDVTPPAIYAGGPFSGRQPFPDATGAPSASFPDNDFATYVELDRVLDAAWRLTIMGSAGLPNGAPNEAILGPAVALEDQLLAGLNNALSTTKTNVHSMTAEEFTASFSVQDPDFQSLLIDLVTQAAFCAPEYGGNPGGSGWQMVHFEGDSLPLGYSAWNGTSYVERPDSPLTTPNPSDPEPLTDDIHQLLALVTSVLGGTAF
ncbi:MAG TPA: gluconate 2-dehydrogenase subunit 3 family protein [Kofleriaceae bacterium]